jgi:hypothetical protein
MPISDQQKRILGVVGNNLEPMKEVLILFALNGVTIIRSMLRTSTALFNAIDAGYATIDHLDGFIESLMPGIDTITEQQTGLFGMFIADQADESRIPKLITELRDHNIGVVPTRVLAERWFAPDKSPEALRSEP